MGMLVPIESIQDKIIVLRWQKIILDRDLAALYGVETKYLKRQVKRNIDRFPEDFMFELTKQEFETVRWHFGTSSLSHWGTRYLPYAFTEHGTLQAANVLNSEMAKEVSIAIIRVFNHMRKTLATHEQLKALVFENQAEIRSIWFELQKLSLDDECDDSRPIGFDVHGE